MIASIAVVVTALMAVANGFSYDAPSAWGGECDDETNASPVDISFPDVEYDYGFQGPTLVSNEGCKVRGFNAVITKY
jgi:hypothetical protein